MVEILIYVYENFFGSGIYPAHGVLVDRLCAAGFSEDDVEVAVTWLNGLDNGVDVSTPALGVPDIVSRCLHPLEFERIGSEGWNFLAYLENSQILDNQQRELILGGVLSLDETEVSIDRLQLLTLMVLWRQGRFTEAQWVEELLYFQEYLLQ